MHSAATGWRACLARFRRRPVTLWSPHPPSECLQRLATVTSPRALASWYLDPRTAGRPVPRLRGTADSSRILVGRSDDASAPLRLAPPCPGTARHRGMAGAVHLASAIALSDPGLLLAVWDRRLRVGASAAGLAVAPARRDP